MTSAEVTVAALQALLSEQTAFTRAFAFEVQAIGDGECALLVPFSPVFERPGGIVSGQVFMTAADVTMWLAIKTRRGLGDPSVTFNMQSSFLRSARREAIVCRARVLRFGARLSYGTAECLNQTGTLLSHHTLTYFCPERAGAGGS
ncbi:MAG TPA: PaaI family thioesterase [Thermoanaerobaculia bacterium]|nr:PaaI family thioesterase [Thermoanaerobaculia bacterium]